MYPALTAGPSLFLIFNARKLPGRRIEAHNSFLRIVLLKDQYQNNATQQSGKRDEFLPRNFQCTIHEKYLRPDQKNGERHQKDLFYRSFRFTLKEAENGDDGKKQTHESCHSVEFFIVRIK